MSTPPASGRAQGLELLGDGTSSRRDHCSRISAVAPTRLRTTRGQPPNPPGPARVDDGRSPPRQDVRSRRPGSVFHRAQHSSPGCRGKCRSRDTSSQRRVEEIDFELIAIRIDAIRRGVDVVVSVSRWIDVRPSTQEKAVDDRQEFVDRSRCGGRTIGTPPAASTARTYGADMQYRKNVPWARVSSCADGVMPIIGFMCLCAFPESLQIRHYAYVSIGKKIAADGRSSCPRELNERAERLRVEHIGADSASRTRSIYLT